VVSITITVAVVIIGKLIEGKATFCGLVLTQTFHLVTQRLLHQADLLTLGVLNDHQEKTFLPTQFLARPPLP